MNASSKYALFATSAFDQRVGHDLNAIIAALQGLGGAKHFKGAVLLGGYGRGEGTALHTSEGEVPFNDYDIVIIADSISKKTRREIQAKLDNLSIDLENEIGIAVDLYLHSQESLRNASPLLLNYEMLHGYQVLWGPPDLLSPMPRFEVSDVPLEEGTRLLMNRGRLLLQVDTPSAQDLQIKYAKFILKNYLAFGDCVLLVSGEYDIFYYKKSERIHGALERLKAPDAAWVESVYRRAIAFRNTGNLDLLLQMDVMKEVERLKRYFPQFLFWYESQRLKTTVTSVSEYCEALAHHSGHSIKNMARNAFVMKSQMFQPSLNWACIHPRNRLYPALCLLLSNNGGNKLLSELIGCDAPSHFDQLALRLG